MTTQIQTVKLLLIPVKYSSEGNVEEAHECSESTYFLKLSLQ